jgi:hypothetical protein
MSRAVVAAGMSVLILAVAVYTKHTQAPIGYDDTPLLPGSKWRVHDGKRPQPTVVTPGPAGAPVAPPADAVVLFDGRDLSKWRVYERGTPARWRLEGDAMVVAAGSGTIESTERFGDVQLHVEFATPAEVAGHSQERGNSGVFLMSRYEIQILDSFDNPTYPDGQAGAIYGQFPPLVNASRRPGEWQSFDIVFTAPRFNGSALVSPARVTVLHNGILVQDSQVLIGATKHRVVGSYEPHGDAEPILLQDHGNPTRFRNIWARRLVAR